VFNTLLESNVTLPSESDISSEEEDLTKVDGGKLSKKTRKELMKMINTKYVFPNFNILLYAENYIFPVASAEVGVDDKASRIIEDNREAVYDLYYKALKLEPESKPELTLHREVAGSQGSSVHHDEDAQATGAAQSQAAEKGKPKAPEDDYLENDGRLPAQTQASRTRGK